MPRPLLFRAILTWVLFVPIAILNGALRQLGYQRWVGELPAHQISTVIGSAVFLVYSYFMMRRHVSGLGNKSLFTVGLLWVILTIGFEFGMGLTAGRSWEYMVSDYYVWEGRLWPLFLLTVLFSPYLIRRIDSALN